MLVGPFPLSMVVERLDELELLKIVGTIAGLQNALQTAPRNTPAAYVLGEESGREQGDYTEASAQPMTATIKVVLWVKHAGDADTGAKALKAMEALEKVVRNQLRAWSPAAPFEPLWISSSGQDQYFGDHLIRQVLFRTHYRDQDMP